MHRAAIVLGHIDAVITAVLKYLTIAIFVSLALIVSANILLRIFPITSLHWTDEIVELCFAALVFYGAAGVWMARGHFSVGNWIEAKVKNERGRNAYRLLIEVLSLLFAAILLKYSLDLTMKAQEATSVFEIPKKVLYSCMPISALIMVLYSFVFVVRAAVGTISPEALSHTDATQEE